MVKSISKLLPTPSVHFKNALISSSAISISAAVSLKIFLLLLFIFPLTLTRLRDAAMKPYDPIFEL